MTAASGPPRPPGLWIACAILLLVAGCESVDSAAKQEIRSQITPVPTAILVSDFAITPEEVTTGRLGNEKLIRDSSRTATERAVGHRFASTFAASLVEEIRRMGLPAERAGAPLPAGGNTASIEGQFISLASEDLSAPGIVGFAADWPNVVADIEIYSTTGVGDQLSDEVEFNLADANLPPERLPAGVLVRLPGGSPGKLPAAIGADLDQTAKAAASAAARQLAPFFADHGWIAPAAPSPS
jgi:Domain of unknown function (DUF4410)